jgi:hypothetical protein
MPCRRLAIGCSTWPPAVRPEVCASAGSRCLLRNLGDAVRAFVNRLGVAVWRATQLCSDKVTVPIASMPAGGTEDIKSAAADRRSQAAYAGRQALHFQRRGADRGFAAAEPSPAP